MEQAQEAKHTPGIARSGTFLYEIDPTGRENLWSGHLAPNNGHSPEHVLKAAVLFEAAPKLLDACKAAEKWLDGWASAEPYLAEIRAAIAKAEGSAA